MRFWGVTKDGYDFLKDKGIGDKVDDNWSSLSRLIPRRAIVDYSEIEAFLKDESQLEERKKVISAWMKNPGYSGERPKDFFMISGAASDAILTRDEIKGFEKLGFSSITELDGLIAAYFFEKDQDLSNLSSPRYVWRSDEFKTWIYGDMHHDMIIHQVLIDSNHYPPEQKRIDSKEIVYFEKLENNYMYAESDFWPVFAAVLIKYAKTVGIEIPKADNWREFMGSPKWDDEIAIGTHRWDGEIISPDFNRVAFHDFVNHYQNMILAQLPNKSNNMFGLTDKNKAKSMFFGLTNPKSRLDSSYLPAIDEEERLVLYVNHSTGYEAVEFAPHGKPIEYYPLIYITKDDVSEFFKGTVHGIMTKQSSTAPQYLAFMFWQWDELKKGTPADKIREMGNDFRKY